MGYKSVRNKALQGSIRLITGTYKGNKWSVPEGYVAINIDLYDGYKLRKDQMIPKLQPRLDDIIDNLKEAKLVDRIDHHHDEMNRVTLFAGTRGACIQKRYLDLFDEVYPGYKAYVIDDRSPVKIMHNDELVGLIMPTRRYE